MEETTWEIGFGTARSGDNLIDPGSQGLNSGKPISHVVSSILG
jgi:hypothetical protein